MQRVNTLNGYLKKRFGEKIYKLSLDGGMTCPNRDGKIGYGGCIFCSASGSGDFAEPVCESISKQIQNAKRRVQSKMKGGGRYIAYFQSFTNTYAPPEYLRRVFNEAIADDDIAALSVATRPDCLGEQVLNLLCELQRIKPVWVELGLQTIHEKSIKYIRRGFDNACFERAASDLKSIGVEVIVHVILGLPNETREQMLQTVRYLNGVGIDGIKLQLLHVLENTDLAEDFRQGRFSAMGMDEYIETLLDCIEELSPQTVVHRMTGDGDKKILVAPQWSADKKTVLNAIGKRLEERDVFQGSRLLGKQEAAMRMEIISRL